MLEAISNQPQINNVNTQEPPVKNPNFRANNDNSLERTPAQDSVETGKKKNVGGKIALGAGITVAALAIADFVLAGGKHVKQLLGVAQKEASTLTDDAAKAAKEAERRAAREAAEKATKEYNEKFTKEMAELDAEMAEAKVRVKEAEEAYQKLQKEIADNNAKEAERAAAQKAAWLAAVEETKYVDKLIEDDRIVRFLTGGFVERNGYYVSQKTGTVVINGVRDLVPGGKTPTKVIKFGEKTKMHQMGYTHARKTGSYVEIYRGDKGYLLEGEFSGKFKENVVERFRDDIKKNMSKLEK